jgi:hypothetical protein
VEPLPHPNTTINLDTGGIGSGDGEIMTVADNVA